MRIQRVSSISAAGRRQGVALVIVLAMLTLIAALVVGFLCRTGSERASAANYGAAMATRQIADTAVNIVQNQINQATTRGSGYVWASQPGAVRVFAPAGALDRIYRLYSASALSTANATDLASDAPSDGDWVNATAVWVDLNAPAVVHSGSQSYSFPILDIRNPVGSGTVSIDGFALQNPPGATATQAAPMPVRWLYLLRNGQILAPDSGSTGKVVTFNQASVLPSKDNPIIGRMAFWADDESCKLNVNTAGDGTFWDTPHFDATDERKRALNQPSAGEFQSYPGHPATTTLKPLFSALGIDTSAAASGSASNLFKIAPRYNDDYGSKMGTVMPSQTPSPKTDRLYSGPGELLFAPARATSGLTRAQLESAKFFVTTHSRAPELNLFGQPRIATWPVSSTNDAAHRTPVDRLIAFCSTVNNQPYYFTRGNSRNPTADISIARNNDLLNYLDHLTSLNVPGVVGSFDSKYGTSERRQILTEIFDYIRCMNLQDTTLADANQYATRDPATNPGQNFGLGQVVPSQMSAWGTQGFGRFCRPTEFSLIFVGVGAGASSSGTATPVLAGQANVVNYVGTLGNRIPASNTIAVQAFLVMNVFDPCHGWSPHYPCFRVEVSDLDKFKLNGQPLGFPATGNFVSKLNVPPLHSRAYGGPMDWRNTLGSSKLSRNTGDYNFYSNILEIPTSGGTMKLTGGTLTVKLYDNNSDLISTYTVNIASPGYDQDGNLVVESIPIPNLATHRLIGVGNVTTTPSASDSPDVVDRFGKGVLNADSFNSTLVESSNDVVYGVVLGSNVGDYRLLARNDVPSNYFVRHPSAGTSRLGFGWDSPVKDFTSSQRGTLLSGSVSVNRKPFVPVTVGGAYVGGGASTIPGDWDNGVATRLDGPFINKPDEGTIYQATSTQVPYFDVDYGYTELGGTFFSANRQIPSAVMFGSLPTGVMGGKPWQTLLFRPGFTGHPGAATPKDHYLLDLFWMPVVEPYAISEPFSTAGKVNLNYQIVPFTYIKRNTALRAVLSDEQVAVVGKMASSYARKKTADSGRARFDLNLDESNGTLRQFKERFSNNDLFRSATEICDVYLVPSNKTWASDAAAQSDWYSDAFQFVGDNTRERPYANIYPRVTTKSSVFRVYYTTQSLQNTSANPSVWSEGKGTITGEYRGATTIERYLNPAAAGIPDAATALDTTSLEGSYRWRVVEHSQFAP